MPAAIIDTTRHTNALPPTAMVAGLSLIERSLRLASVCGCEEVWVVASSDISTEFADTGADLDFIHMVLVDPEDTGRLQRVVTAARQSGCNDEAVVMPSSTVFERGMVKDFIGESTGSSHPRAVDGDGGARDLLWLPEGMLLAASVEDFVDARRAFTTLETDHDDRWQAHLEDPSDARDAEDWLWNSCRKSVDGIVSRNLNRHISLAISRFLAPTSIKPNHISYFTFALGIIAGILAGVGGWFYFALAGLVFQINSVVDGCDGELARVKYEFSVTGEWLDTLSDDFSDVFFWIGLGIGAWRTFEAPFGLEPDIWLWLAGISVAGKLASMALYYRWLIAHKRGDLLAFQWSFDDEEAGSPLAKLLAKLKYLTKKDFIVFAAMIMGFAGILPYLLVAAAPGNLVVAFSVASQEWANRARAGTGS